MPKFYVGQKVKIAWIPKCDQRKLLFDPSFQEATIEAGPFSPGESFTFKDRPFRNRMECNLYIINTSGPLGEAILFIQEHYLIPPTKGYSYEEAKKNIDKLLENL